MPLARSLPSPAQPWSPRGDRSNSVCSVRQAWTADPVPQARSPQPLTGQARVPFLSAQKQSLTHEFQSLAGSYIPDPDLRTLILKRPAQRVLDSALKTVLLCPSSYWGTRPDSTPSLTYYTPGPELDSGLTPQNSVQWDRQTQSRRSQSCNGVGAQRSSSWRKRWLQGNRNCQVKGMG